MPNVKVVLIQDVPSLGQIGDVAAVAAGYARNYLLPKRLAVTATAKRLDDAQFQRELESRREQVARAEADRFGSILRGQTLVIAVKVGDQGRMHGQITNLDVASAIQEQLGLELDRHLVQIDNPIRSLGRYLLPIRITAGVEVSVTLEVTEYVEPEETPEELEAEEPVAEEPVAEESGLGEAGAEVLTAVDDETEFER